MSLKRAGSPFRFVTQANLTQITPWKARNLRQLLEHLKQAPESVVYHHTHRFLQQHQFLSPEPPNDFAYWVSTALKEEHLAEKLYAIDTVRIKTLRELREKVIETIEQWLARHSELRQAPKGQEFYFMQSVSFVFATPYEAWDLEGFKEALKKTSINSLYYHIFEARIRPPLGQNDFSTWLERELGEAKLAEVIAKMDPYTQTLEGLRERIVRMVEKQIERSGVAHVRAG